MTKLAHMCFAIQMALVAVFWGSSFACSTSFAQSSPLTHSPMLRNPMIHFCNNIAGGSFEIQQPSAINNVPLCRFNLVAIDAQSIVLSVDGVHTLAASILLSDIEASACSTLNAKEMVLASGEAICEFVDHSRLTLATVNAPTQDPDRLRLKQFLTSR